jgi:hypothetical protein
MTNRQFRIIRLITAWIVCSYFAETFMWFMVGLLFREDQLDFGAMKFWLSQSSWVLRSLRSLIAGAMMIFFALIIRLFTYTMFNEIFGHRRKDSDKRD